MNAPDRNNSDEGEGGQRLSSELWPCLHSVHAAAGGEDAMDASPYSIRARSRQQSRPPHPPVLPPGERTPWPRLHTRSAHAAAVKDSRSIRAHKHRQGLRLHQEGRGHAPAPAG